MNDLVAPLRTAIGRANPNWMSQPSHLRRRLEEELGPEARRHRAQIHQLVVAAEERIPIRLQRNGWSPMARQDLGGVLVATRGWTEQAADWAVTTWAAALELSEDRPTVPVPSVRPGAEHHGGSSAGGASLVAATAIPSEVRPVPTALAPEVAVAAVLSDRVPVATDLPSELSDPTTDAPAWVAGAATELPSDPPARPRPGPSDVAPSPLPRANRTLTKRTAAYLDRPLDAAYEAKAGRSPIVLPLVALAIGLPCFLGALALGSVWVMPFTMTMFIGVLIRPARVVAVSGVDVWLLRKHKISNRPTALLATGTRDDVRYAGGRPYPSVRFGGERLWFQKKRAVARRIPTAPTEASLGAGE